MAPSVTVTTAARSSTGTRYGIFQYLLTTADALALTFANAPVGQTIFLLLKQASSSTATTLTLPTGTIVAGTAAATASSPARTAPSTVVQVTCTAPGVYLAIVN